MRPTILVQNDSLVEDQTDDSQSQEVGLWPLYCDVLYTSNTVNSR